MSSLKDRLRRLDDRVFPVGALRRLVVVRNLGIGMLVLAVVFYVASFFDQDGASVARSAAVMALFGGGFLGRHAEAVYQRGGRGLVDD